MPLPRRLWRAAGPVLLGVGTLAAGCSYEHGALSDQPDPTSLGNAGRMGIAFVSTAEGLARRPGDPSAAVPGTTQGTTSPLTTEARPPRTLYGVPADWTFGQSVQAQTALSMQLWTAGPVLPVEPWNMALGPPEGEGGEGHRGHAKGQPAGL